MTINLETWLDLLQKACIEAELKKPKQVKLNINRQSQMNIEYKAIFVY